MAPKRLSVKQIENLRKHRFILEKLASSNLKNRKIILRNSPPELFRVLGLVFDMLANKRLDLNAEQHDILKKHKKLIRTTSGLKGGGVKQKLIAQRGGALATILKTVLPVIGGLPLVNIMGPKGLNGADQNFENFRG